MARYVRLDIQLDDIRVFIAVQQILQHRDSTGVEQIIRPGEVNWMTAGSGISHSERFEDPVALAGGKLEMIQTWVALPEKDEESAPMS